MTKSFSEIKFNLSLNKQNIFLGGSPGLVVMGGDSRFKGCGFESRHLILYGHFFTYICCKNLSCLFEKTENKRKRGRGWPIFFKKKIKHKHNIKSGVKLKKAQQSIITTNPLMLKFGWNQTWVCCTYLIRWLIPARRISLPAVLKLFTLPLNASLGHLHHAGERVW